nr:MAG TPA: hypothetical protein [Caudoviricetes sp.]
MRGKPLSLAVRLTAALQSRSPGEGSLSRRMAGETRPVCHTRNCCGQNVRSSFAP